MILEIIVLTIFIATIFNILLNSFKMPTIIWYIITGAIVSYIFDLDYVNSNESLKTIAEFGIVFLMFTIWLEFSVKNLLKIKKNVFLFGFLQFFLTSILFFIISFFIFSIWIKESILISLALTMSSTAIVLKMLNESWDINKLYWNRSLWILIFQDLMVIPILLLVTIFSYQDSSVWVLLSQTFISAIILFFILWFIGRYLLDYFLTKVALTKSNEIFIGSILFIVIWSSTLSHMLWFSYSLWSLVAWMLIAETHFKHQVESDLIPFRDLLLGVFFITVWMQLDIFIIYEKILVILILLFSLTIIKVSLLYLVLILFNNSRSSFKTAISLFQFWEFWIVIFELTMHNNLIPLWIWQILLSVIILSMIISPFILKNITYITNFIFWPKWWGFNWYKFLEKLDKHIIVIGYGRLWKQIVRDLEDKKINFIIIENSLSIYKKAKNEWKPIVFWNIFNINLFHTVNANKATSIIITFWSKKKLFLLVDSIKKSWLDLDIIVRVNNYKEESFLKNEIGIKKVVVETEKTSQVMVNKIF